MMGPTATTSVVEGCCKTALHALSLKGCSCAALAGACYLYGRSFNPTVRYLGRQLAALEGTEAGYACSSGMAAISATLLQLCSSGDHIVASNTVYGGTFALLKSFFPAKCGIRTTFVDIADLELVTAAVTPATRVRLLLHARLTFAL